MPTPAQLTVGVLGGMGPAATVDFLDRLVQATSAASDQEHLHLLVDINPQVPDRNAAISGRGPSPGPALAAMAARLEEAGADFLVMTCNAAHAYAAEILAATSIPFVSIVEETAAALAELLPPDARAGVLASSGCLEARLYQSALTAHDLEAVTPTGDLLEAFMGVLYRIKAGDIASARPGMREIALALVAAGAETIVSACTEVPLVLAGGDLPCPLLNSTDVLVRQTIRYARRELPLPARR